MLPVEAFAADQYGFDDMELDLAELVSGLIGKEQTDGTCCCYGGRILGRLAVLLVDAPTASTARREPLPATAPASRRDANELRRSLFPPDLSCKPFARLAVIDISITYFFGTKSNVSLRLWTATVADCRH